MKTKLTEKQNKIFQECLNAVINGPFIPDWEFSILFGASKEEVERVLKNWSDRNEEYSSFQLILNNTLNIITGYPISNEDQWAKFISADSDEVRELYDEWVKKGGIDL